MVKNITVTRAIGPGNYDGHNIYQPMCITWDNGDVVLTESVSEVTKLTGINQRTIRETLKSYPGYATYQGYNGARLRCIKPNNPGYRYYGGRGILFKFNSYEEYVNELGPKPGPGYSVDRIDNNGNYEAGNVRWASSCQQANNKRSNIQYAVTRMIGPCWLRPRNGKPCIPCCIHNLKDQSTVFTESISEAAELIGVTRSGVQYQMNLNQGGGLLI